MSEGIKNKRLIFALNEEDFNLISARAKLLRMSKSEYIRFCTRLPFEIIDNDGKPDVYLINKNLLRRMVLELNACGRNLNQAARALNIIKVRYNSWPRYDHRIEELFSLMKDAADGYVSADKNFFQLAESYMQLMRNVDAIVLYDECKDDSDAISKAD